LLFYRSFGLVRLFAVSIISSLHFVSIPLEGSLSFDDANSNSQKVRFARQSPKGPILRHELNVLALYRGSERYFYVFDDESREKLIEVIRSHASDPKVSLSWFDAAVLTERARTQGKQVTNQES